MPRNNIANLPHLGEAASPRARVRRGVGGRATEEEILLIDEAVITLRRAGQKKITRGDFMIESAVERAKRLLAERQAA